MPWEFLGGGHFVEAPAIVHWATNRIDIVVQDWPTDEYQYKFWDRYGWRPNATSYYPKGKFANAPVLISWGLNNLNILGINEEGKLMWQAWNQTDWVLGPDVYFEIGNLNGPINSDDNARSKEITADRTAQILISGLKEDM